jgi:molecular chaperone DnaK
MDSHEGKPDERFSWTRAQPSVFTTAVVQGLQDGSADLDGDGWVSAEELYNYVHEHVRQRVPGQTPTLSMDSAQGSIYLARSPCGWQRPGELRSAVADAQVEADRRAAPSPALLGVREPTRRLRLGLAPTIADADPG